MPQHEAEIGFAQLGLGSVLKQNQLAVPPNQREYAWESKEVTTLLKDFARAIVDEGEQGYFLGTIVTIPTPNGVLEVVDGQQRLATTALLLAAIRDYLEDREPLIYESINNDFLTVIDRNIRGRVPRLQLNLDDNDFFRALVTRSNPAPQPTKESHSLLAAAFDESSRQVQKIVAGFDGKDHGDILNRWLNFIETKAWVILLRVPNAVNAYRMFETLNDRGKRTSQADLVKNYLFGRAGERLPEVQQRWAYMRGALETMDEEDITIIFLRHALTAIHGFVRETNVYETVQNYAKAVQPAVTFVDTLEILANNYVATYNHEHEKWNKYSDATRRAIEVLNLLDIKPMRALVLALTHRFSEKEAEQAFRFCISLGVRLMIASSTRTGSVEEGLANAARGAFAMDIQTAAGLADVLANITPSDVRFKAAFEIATVSNRKLARYYLRSLEMAAKNEAEPWHIPNDDRSVINLEHVLPEKTEGNWPQFADEQVKLHYKRIGNLALLRASENSGLRSLGFEHKKDVYRECPYVLTSQIAEVGDWTSEAIIERQRILAELAVEAWPV